MKRCILLYLTKMWEKKNRLIKLYWLLLLREHIVFVCRRWYIRILRNLNKIWKPTSLPKSTAKKNLTTTLYTISPTLSEHPRFLWIYISCRRLFTKLFCWIDACPTHDILLKLSSSQTSPTFSRHCVNIR